MDFLTDWLTGWLKDLLIDGIMGNLGGLFDNVNSSVGAVAAQVGTTPAAWNAGVFSLIRQLSETVILPIAGMVLTFVATYELIQMLLEKNNMHEVDVANIYKWMFKTAIAILILSNTFNIVMAVFDVSQSVIADASGLVQGSTDISADMLADLETTLEGMGLGSLLGLFMQSILIQVCMVALNIIIFVIVYGRMLEIYVMSSLAPLPMATLANRELGGMGQNYIKSLFAVGFQGLLILVCVAIYAVLVQGIATGGDPIGAIGGLWATRCFCVSCCSRRAVSRAASLVRTEEGGETTSKTITLGSLFDGIGVFPLAAWRNGIVPLWASEIEKAPVSITRRHFPDMAHLGDVTALDGGAVPPVDVLTFGSPCQNLSQIGNRAGLSGEKSSLFFHAIRIIQEMRDATGNQYPAFAVWENVMGTLSSGDRLDFGAVLSAFLGSEVPMPPAGRWANAGMVRGGCPDLCWRLLDAQYWAEPRLARRQRIFLVADFRGRRAAQVLFKPRPMLPVPAPCRKSELPAPEGDRGPFLDPGGRVPIVRPFQ